MTNQLQQSIPPDLPSPRPNNLPSPRPTNLHSPRPTNLHSPRPTNLHSPRPTNLPSPLPINRNVQPKPTGPNPTGPKPTGENCGFDGVATNVKVLLKLIHDHKGSRKENDDRKSQRVAGMISIIDEVKSRIQTIQSSKRITQELRRSNTELRPNIARDKKPSDFDSVTDEKERLQRELTASLVSRKSLQSMCFSLGKEKQNMASQLARKAQELTEMEEFVEDLKAQKETLLEKLKESKSEKRNNSLEAEIMQVLQQRSKALYERLQQSFDGSLSLKKKLKEKQEENSKIHATAEEMQAEVQAGIKRIHDLKELMVTTYGETYNFKEEISTLEQMLESLNMRISKHRNDKPKA